MNINLNKRRDTPNPLTFEEVDENWDKIALSINELAGTEEANLKKLLDATQMELKWGNPSFDEDEESWVRTIRDGVLVRMLHVSISNYPELARYDPKIVVERYKPAKPKKLDDPSGAYITVKSGWRKDVTNTAPAEENDYRPNDFIITGSEMVIDLKPENYFQYLKFNKETQEYYERGWPTAKGVKFGRPGILGYVFLRLKIIAQTPDFNPVESKPLISFKMYARDKIIRNDEWRSPSIISYSLNK